MVKHNSGSLHVLHIIETLDTGGAECVLVDLVNRMPDNVTSSVCCIKHTGEMAKRIRPDVRIFALGKGEGNAFFLPFSLALKIRAMKVDVVHTHNWGVFCEGMLAALLAGVKIKIHMAHGGFLEHPATLAGKTKRTIRRIVERFISLFCSVIISVSQELKFDIIRVIGVPSKKIKVMRNGISIPEEKQAPDSKLLKEISYNKNLFYIAFVGRLVTVKNVPFLLEAVQKIVKVRPNARLIIVGQGEECGSLKKKTRELGIMNNIQFLGHREDVRSILSICHLFVLPSFSEGVSISLLEAMSMGLPVVATQVGGNTEVIVDQHTGILVPSGDVEALTDAMQFFINNPEACKRYGRNGFERVYHSFNIDSNIRELVDMYSGKIQ